MEILGTGGDLACLFLLYGTWSFCSYWRLYFGEDGIVAKWPSFDLFDFASEVEDGRGDMLTEVMKAHQRYIGHLLMTTAMMCFLLSFFRLLFSPTENVHTIVGTRNVQTLLHFFLEGNLPRGVRDGEWSA